MPAEPTHAAAARHQRSRGAAKGKRPNVKQHTEDIVDTRAVFQPLMFWLKVVADRNICAQAQQHAAHRSMRHASAEAAPK